MKNSGGSKSEPCPPVYGLRVPNDCMTNGWLMCKECRGMENTTLIKAARRRARKDRRLERRLRAEEV